jgi:16S rRNA (cytosine967-C5)-methyltransferase
LRREATHRDVNRLKHAARLWKEYAGSPAPRQLDRWLAETLRAEKSFGSQDRRFYSDVFFAAARTVTTLLFEVFLEREKSFSSPGPFWKQTEQQQLAQINSFSAQVSTEKDLWAALQSLPPEKVIECAYQNADVASEVMSAQAAFRSGVIGFYRERLESNPDTLESILPLLLVAHGIPPAWSAALQQRVLRSSWSSAQLLDFLRLQNVRPPLWIRINHPERCSEVIQDLTAHDLEISWIVQGHSAVVSGSFGVYQCDTFKAGLFEVQDGASQQIARTVAAQPGQKIWDACAGGGGKTVALAAALQGKGALYASDIRSHKLEEAKRRCQRAGFHNVRTLVWNGEELPKFGKEVHLQAGFDAVLVDAPCTSSGTWRRNPDARLRISDPIARASLHQLQLQLLSQAATRVRPGGRIVYGTCSWCVEENEGVVDSFLSLKKIPAGFERSTEFLLGAPQQDSDTMFAASLLFSESDANSPKR